MLGLTIALAAAAPLFAHDNFRIIGTLTRVQKTLIDVKHADGKTITIKVDKQTEFVRDKKKVDASEVKTGLSVVVDAYGDSEKDLLALEIRIVPPIGKR
jgi:biopolymer transport protein ExbD